MKTKPRGHIINKIDISINLTNLNTEMKTLVRCNFHIISNTIMKL